MEGSGAISSVSTGRFPVATIREAAPLDAYLPSDRVSIRMDADEVEPGTPATEGNSAEAKPGEAKPDGAKKTALEGVQRLTFEQQRVVVELQLRDRGVRNHEAAHQAAGGHLAGAASFSYEQGPDGKSYAVGGEVSIDMSPGRTPRETLERARRIRAAAMAPADPSAQDMTVAGAAATMEARASVELSMEMRGEAGEKGAAKDGEGSKSGAVLRMQPGGTAHLHSPDGCGACSKGVAYYRALARSA